MKTNKVLAVGLSLLFGALGGAFAGGEALPSDRNAQIDQVSKTIKKKGAKWVAGRTSASDLPEQDWTMLVGLNFAPISVAPAPMGAISKAPLPESLDWRSNNGNFVTDARNQGKCGSCWAFAMTGALEAYTLRTNNTPNRDLDLSEQVMLSCSGAGSCNGGQLNATFLRTTGLPTDDYYPYTQTDGSCANVKPGWQDVTYKIGSWGSVPTSVNSLKAALNKFGPIPTAFMVYEDFMHYKGGVYTYTTGKKLGGHGVLLVGYNDAEKYFIVKNSWGPDWGENGFFKIAYSEMNNDVMFGMMTIAYYTADQANN